MFSAKLGAGWKICQCIGATLYYSSLCIFWALWGKLTREKMDVYNQRWSRSLLRHTDIVVRTFGEFDQSEPDRPLMYISNHASLFDIPIALKALPGSIRMLAKSEMKYWPFLGLAMRAGEYIFIDRKDTEKAKQSLVFAKTKMQSGIRLWVYPEGTRSPDGEVSSFKKGAFHLAIELKAIIVPVAICGSAEVLKKNTLTLVSGRSVDVMVGDTIDAGKYHKDQVQELCSLAEETVKLLKSNGLKEHWHDSDDVARQMVTHSNTMTS